jgi:Kdo2-lipid IVA lauroyltransferase/acyltransferase
VSRKAAEQLASMPTTGPRTWPVWALLTAVTWFVAVWPAPVTYALFRALGALVATFAVVRERGLARRRRGALRNMRIAFGAPVDRRLVSAYGRHVAWLLLEVLRMKRMTPARARRMVDVRAFDTLRALLAEGKGVIIASGHMGNWEVMSYAGGLLRFEQVVLNRPCPEPGLERFLREHRARSGQRILSKFGGMWPLKKTLDKGGVVGINVDENTRDGLFVPFCGALAGTNTSAAHLQRLTGAPILVLTCQRLAPERFRIHAWGVVRPEANADKDAETLRVTSAVARLLEESLRRYPDQWLWSLRRWETRPAGEVETPDRLPPRVGAALAPALGSRA